MYFTQSFAVWTVLYIVIAGKETDLQWRRQGFRPPAGWRPGRSPPREAWPHAHPGGQSKGVRQWPPVWWSIAMRDFTWFSKLKTYMNCDIPVNWFRECQSAGEGEAERLKSVLPWAAGRGRRGPRLLCSPPGMESNPPPAPRDPGRVSLRLALGASHSAVCAAVPRTLQNAR